MHYFIYPSKDSWISSGSNPITGITELDQNFGQDEILDLKKVFENDTFKYQTRVLVQFDLSEVSASVVKGSITNPKYFLRLYEAQGNSNISTEYKLAAFPISQSWDEGRGKFGDNPKVTNGCSWENRSYPDSGNAVTWSSNAGVQLYGGAIATGSTFEESQSFSYETPDINMNVTDIVNGWFDGTINSGNNHGFLLRFSGSQETDESTFGGFKFFSKQTNTIYAPKLEVRWDDHLPCTGSNTGSLSALDLTGASDIYLYPKYLAESYKENEKVKFRFGARKQYIQKSFSTSVQTISGSYIPEGSGSYSIMDIATGETIVPFSAYTSMSCDSTSPYFIQWMDTFTPDRVYKILLKLKYDDGQERIFDNDFEFKVRR